MKLAAICPIGNLNRMGYQNVAEPCINSMAEFADRVYLVQSMRDDDDAFLWALDRWNNIEVVAGWHTYMARNVDGTQRFNSMRILENCNVGLKEAREEGCDAAVVLFSNNYIPEPSMEPLKRALKTMLSRGDPWAWHYRMDQLAGQLFHASVMMPFLVNLHSRPLMRIAFDAITDEQGVWKMKRGNFSECDGRAIVDVQLEMTVEDLAEKMNFIRCYADLVPKRSPVFSWDGYWRKYYIEKFKRKAKSDAPLSPTGQRIAELCEPDFVSREVLGALG
jgi:hypothetical protein